jgi:NADH-quinone oxidoreductase subunit A
MSPLAIVAYLVLFAVVGFLFLFLALLLGRFLRANLPSPQKAEPYECGEPPVGPAFIQFDLRFYVVALVFIVFEVEVALFFPPATVFGKATQVMSGRASETTAAELRGVAADVAGQEKQPVTEIAPDDARTLALAAMADLGVFFAVILLGFAYVWWRGDLDWVRAVGREGPMGQRSALEAQGTGLRIST